MASGRRRVRGVKLSASSFSPKAIKNYLKHLFTTKEGLKKIGTIAVIFIGLLVALFGWYAKDLPTPNKINGRMSAQTTQIFDRNGKLLYEMHGDKNRILVEFNEIPDNIKNATVAVEDKNFYKHTGFSPTRIVGSALYNVFNRVAGGNFQGGSTITQQFVKNAILSPEQTFGRKIRELILSMELEAMYKKDDILKMYLNEIPYGSNAYGVKVAAKTYFDKELKDITLEEAAILAALPQAPTFYSPFGDNKDGLLDRKDTVLQLMADQGYVNQEEADAAMAKEVKFANNPYGSITAPHFVMYVKQKLVEKYGEQMANEGGLKVYTTLDLELYNAANSAVQEIGAANDKKYKASNAALVSIDPKTGQILAMVGSRDFFNEEIDGNVNVAIRDRQPGSSFKPLSYAALLKKDSWGAGSVLYDVKTDFGGGYNPSNYDGSFRGNVTVRKALAGSLNIPAVKGLYIAGMKEVLDTAHAMGITTLNNPENYGLSLVLGAGEVKPLDMATAYGVFGNGGIKQEPAWFVKIEDRDGKTLDEYKKQPGKQVLDPQIAYIMSDILSDNNARSYVFGSRSSLFISGYTVAAKTGTTNDNKDAWTVGYTPSISTAVWAGNNDGTAMNKAGGSTAAAPIWNRYMKFALTKLQKEDFKRPTGVKTVTLDALTGRQVTSATTAQVTDIFPSWYKTPGAGSSQEVKTDKLNGKLATDKCPAEVIVTKIYSAITAEIPKTDSAYARWNAAVAAWASSRGYSTDSGSIPTEACDLHTGGDLPSVDITGAVKTSGNNYTVSMQASTPKGFKSLVVSVGDKTYAAEAIGNHYEIIIALTPGTYKLTATVKDAIFQTASDTLDVTAE
jgi:1A family penicillin-binding protein